MSTPYQKAAGAKASKAGLVSTYILQYGKKQACDEYVNSGNWDAAWGEPKFKKQPKSQKSAVAPDMTPSPVEPDQDTESMKQTIIKTSIKIIKNDHIEIAFHLANGLPGLKTAAKLRRYIR